MPNLQYTPVPSAELLEVADGNLRPSTQAFDAIYEELLSLGTTGEQAMARELLRLRGGKWVD